jgi:hypothetical protein
VQGYTRWPIQNIDTVHNLPCPSPGCSEPPGVSDNSSQTLADCIALCDALAHKGCIGFVTQKDSWVNGTVCKRNAFLEPLLHFQTIVLPRQARDKHTRKNLRTMAFCAGEPYRSVLPARHGGELPQRQLCAATAAPVRGCLRTDRIETVPQRRLDARQHLQRWVRQESASEALSRRRLPAAGARNAFLEPFLH